MKRHGVEVERSRCPSAIEISEDVDELSSLDSYPVKVGEKQTAALQFANDNHYRLRWSI